MITDAQRQKLQQFADKNYTNGKIAELIGTSESTVSKARRGLMGLRAESIEKLDALDVSKLPTQEKYDVGKRHRGKGKPKMEKPAKTATAPKQRATHHAGPGSPCCECGETITDGHEDAIYCSKNCEMGKPTKSTRLPEATIPAPQTKVAASTVRTSSRSPVISLESGAKAIDRCGVDPTYHETTRALLRAMGLL